MINQIVWFMTWWGWPFLTFILLILTQITFFYRIFVNKFVKSRALQKYSDLAIKFYEQTKLLNKLKKEIADLKGNVYDPEDDIDYDKIIEEITPKSAVNEEKKEKKNGKD